MVTPLEQFKVIIVLPLSILGFDFSVSNVTLYLILVSFFLFLLFNRGTQNNLLVPDPLQRLAESCYIFMNNMVKQQSGLRGLVYFPILITLFFLLLFLNLVGLTPYGFTGTSQMSYTFTLGFGMFIGIIIIALSVQKSNFIKLFIPETTGPILPLLVIIEIFSYCIRPFSLSIRLFANMLAGHTLLHILASFGISLLKVDFLFALAMGGPIVAICVLEFGIAFLQAYVFVVLVCIYLKESFYGH